MNMDVSSLSESPSWLEGGLSSLPEKQKDH